MTITQVQLLSIPVSDQDRARDFYRDVLGLTVRRDHAMGPTGRWVEVAPDGGATSMTLVTWFPSMPPGSLDGLVLRSDDLDRDVETLTRRGVEIPDGVQQAPWGRYVTFRDPDGNRLTLQSPPSGQG